MNTKLKMICAMALLALTGPAFAAEGGNATVQLTDKQVDAYLHDSKFGAFDPKTVNLPTRDNSDPDYQAPYKLSLLKPLSREAAWEEGAWQAMNVVDMLQTIQIAKNPGCYEEVGTARMFVGAHPSKGEAIAVSVGFGVAHYLVSRMIDSLTDRNPDYKYLQRGWQIVSGVPKAMTIANNNRIGLGPFHTVKCTR